MNDLEISQAKCTSLDFRAPVQLKKQPDKDAEFIIEAYTGQPVERWWGVLAIDISGIKAKKNMPIFQSHDPKSIAGFSTDSWKDGSFYVSGKFSQTTRAGKEVKSLAQEGFPWQASMGVSPIKILSLEKDAKHQVNGQTIKGPAEVWLESQVLEVSFVPLGADDNTSISMLSAIQEQQEPTTLPGEEVAMAMTMEKLRTEHHDIANALIEEGRAEGRKDGARAELERIKSIRAQTLAGHETLIEAMIDDGATTGEQAAIRILQAERQLRASAVANLAVDGAAIPAVPVTSPPPVEPTAQAEDLSTDDGLKAAWDKNAAYRDEFQNFDVFVAYHKNKHRAKVR